jgi:hypothetical protein
MTNQSEEPDIDPFPATKRDAPIAPPLPQTSNPTLSSLLAAPPLWPHSSLMKRSYPRLGIMLILCVGAANP